ncbi:MAG: hypothetical protein HUU49_04885 [Candidatus Buchananbacteria bacterium]|nr:hypothetical protein [Candidatus Buchananbacteria bacterium]
MKKILATISQQEWRLVWLLALVMIIITGLPYLAGYFFAPNGFTYNGLHALSPGDIPVYYSYINQARSGEIFVKNLLTPEPQAFGTLNIWWAWIGQLAGIFNLPVILAFQLSRLIMIPVFLTVAYIFIAYFFSDRAVRLTALIFLLFSSGLGFYVAAPIDALGIEGPDPYRWPIDLWLTEANTFNTLYQTSHFIASITLMILIFLLMALAFESRRKMVYAAVSGVLALCYFNFHPYYFPVIFGVLGLYLFGLMLRANRFLWREAGYLIVVFLISLPSVIYHFWLIGASPVIGQRAIQNVTNISPFIFVVLGYGLLWLGFILGLWFLWHQKKFDRRHWLLLSWFIVDIVLIYSPFPFHSRYTQGLHIILVIFTVIGLSELGAYLRTRLKPATYDFWINNSVLLILLFVIWLMPSNLYSVGRDFYFIFSNSPAITTKLFLPNGLFDAYAWLATQQSRAGVVFGADIPLKFAPGFSGHAVYAAHAHETLFFGSKAAYIQWFFLDNDYADKKHEFLLANNISYLIYSDYEKELGSFNPALHKYLHEVFSSQGVTVYQVVQ